MSGREFLIQARTVGLVALITLLVWLMAEAESLRTARLRTEIQFRAKPESGRLVRLEPGQDFKGSAIVSVEGPTADVDSLAARIRGVLELEPGMEGVPAEPGRQTVNLAEALRAHPAFRDSQVTIAAVEPASATVVVDTIVTRDIPLKVEVPEGTLLDGPPVADRATVSVRLPETVARTAGELQATARLTPELIQTLREGWRVELLAPVSLPPAIHAEALRITPQQVRVSLILRSRSATTVIPGIPVHVKLPPTETGEWVVELAPESRLLTDVSVTGPADLIEQVRTERIRPVAFITLSSDDLERAAASGQPLEREVQFSDLPTLLKFEPRQKTVKLTVRGRA